MSRTWAGLVMTCCICPTGLHAADFEDFRKSFKSQVDAGFGPRADATWNTKVLAARKDFLAQAADKTTAAAAMSVHFSLSGEPLSLDPIRAVVHTGDKDCS